MVEVPYGLVAGYVFIIGACIGSFLNVVIARLPEGESIVRPRSRCPRCRTPIAWYDNIPLLSYVLLRARCRHCRAPISPRYFLVELLMGALATALFVRLGFTWHLLFWGVLSAALVAITFLDIDHFWVPDVLTYPSMVLAAAASLLPGGVTPMQAALGLLPAVGLWLIAFTFEKAFHREGMGMGDIKLMAVLGLALGPYAAIVALFFAAVQGSIIGVIKLLLAPRDEQQQQQEQQPHQAQQPQQRERPQEEGPEAAEEEWVPHPRAVPFGPFLVLGCLEVVLFPELLDVLSGIAWRFAEWLA